MVLSNSLCRVKCKDLASAETAAYSDICEDFEQRMTQQFAVTVELIRAS